MISIKHRFHGSGSIRKVFARGKAARGQMMALKFTERANGAPYRLAVVVSTKVSKSAVVRNRIRRRVYEVFRAHSGELNGSYDMVITIFDDKTATMPFSRLETSIAKLLTQAGIIAHQ